MCRHFMEETRINNKPITTGKQTTITFNNSQRTKETLGLYMLYIQESNKLKQDKIQTTKHHGRQEVT